MPIWRYAFATLIPLALLLAGALWGGWWAGLALIWLTLLAAGLDHLLTPPRGPVGHSSAADPLSVVLALGHVALLALTAHAFGAPSRSIAEQITLLLAAGSFLGQVSHPNAHELIHRSPRALRRLGGVVYSSMLFGHHVSAHRLVHHTHVGTPDDPNTPRPGESFWAFLPRAWIGSFRAGLAAERARDARRRGPNPYLWYLSGSAVTLGLAVLLGGPGGAAGLVALALLAHVQILLSDYVQHYGLSRKRLANGKWEPVAARHSWNAPRGFTSYLMVNAPAHSDHHMHPDTPYDALQTPVSAPTLPWSMPVMAMLATMPRRWRKVMDKRAAKAMSAPSPQTGRET
ncbi:alkane 1-monooxygenase [Nioella aestuarii]|uniref:alkane 1-monooxygenase n=1 Tax=Nioella aestuarii TaxID=1662864 RepID=UPI003D7F3409